MTSYLKTEHRRFAPCVFTCRTSYSEHQFQGELELARRAGLARWKSRSGNTAKVRRPNNIARLAEVRMVKHVKELGPELQALPFAKLRSFDYGEIRIVESRPDNDIAAKVPELRWNCKDRGIEPLVYVTYDLDWSY
jgi:hypothetical protein